jgi:hypothetical protein
MFLRQDLAIDSSRLLAIHPSSQPTIVFRQFLTDSLDPP